MINIGVLGVGEWGKNHARVYRELENSNLVMVADLSGKRLNALNRKYKVDVTDNYYDILNNPEIEAVSVCTPSSTHFKIVKECFETGKHVLVEKPLCLTSSNAQELIDLSEEYQKILMVGHIFRYNPAVRKLKAEIEKDTFGKLFFLYGSRMGLRTPRDDCGVIFDFALHDFDVFCFLLNELPIDVTAIGNPYLREPYEDVGIITLRFPDNILANVQVSWLTPKKIRDIWIVGQKKSASLDYMSQEIEIYDIGVVPEYDSFGGFKLITREGDTYMPYIQNLEPLKLEISHFLECVENEKQPLTDGNVGLQVIKIIEGAYKSIQEKRTVSLRE
jgi:predicted dehydrogenase